MHVKILRGGTVSRGARDPETLAESFFDAGETVNVPDAVALSLVANGHAETADELDDLSALETDEEGDGAPGELEGDAPPIDGAQPRRGPGRPRRAQ